MHVMHFFAGLADAKPVAPAGPYGTGCPVDPRLPPRPGGQGDHRLHSLGALLLAELLEPGTLGGGELLSVLHLALLEQNAPGAHLPLGKPT